MSKIYVGSFVKVNSNFMGIGKLCAISTDKKTVEVTYFHSINKQTSAWFPVLDIQSVALEHQTRCYYYDTEKEEWKMGRALRKIDDEYEVDFPDTFSTYIPENELNVRCAESTSNPMEVLSILGQETSFFYQRRHSFLQMLIEQRAVASGMTGLISSGIEILPHQVQVIRRVLEDPIPRYLLADEVGMGKTIEAGVILRQKLLDYPNHQALILAPTFLLTQWEEELTQRCLIEQFPGRIHFAGLESFDNKYITIPDIIIVDEAHELARMAFSKDPIKQKRYDTVKNICHSAKTLLLLSATPVLNNEWEFLSMLHILAPDQHRLEDIDAFRYKLDKRQEVGKSLLSFREETQPFLIKRRIESFRMLFSEDKMLLSLLDELEISLDPEHEGNRKELIRRIRIHISETYRLHRRMLRNRRDNIKSLFQYHRGELPVMEEWDLDERTEEIHLILDDHRIESWAAEREVWEDEDAVTSPRLSIWMSLLEAVCTDENLLRDVVIIRKERKLIEDMSDIFSEINLQYLVETPHFEGEPEMLDRLLRVLAYSSEMGDKNQLLATMIQHTQKRAQHKKMSPRKIVVFTQHTRVCKHVTQFLKKVFGDKAVDGYFMGLKREQIELVTTNFRDKSECQILVCDKTGEIGRNFQFADEMIHYDLPFAPNQLEQRIGRLDRLGRNKPFRISVLTGPDTEVNYQWGWHRFLKEGLNIYNDSISSLQFFIDAILPDVLRNLYMNGLPGLEKSIEGMHTNIHDEKVRIAEQQIIDEIDVYEQQASDFFDQLVLYESNPERIQQSIEPWVCEAMRFKKIENGGQIIYKPASGTLLPTQHLVALNEQMERPGCFDREIVIKNNNNKLFRLGDPFFDVLSGYLRKDDRGQSYAFWRKVKSWTQDTDWLGFRLHYIVEGDLKPLINLLEARGLRVDLKVYQRLLDKFFKPTYVEVILDYQGNRVDDEHEYLLAGSYCDVEDGGTDTSIIKDRLQVIRDTFSTKQWQKICAMISSQSLQYLNEDPEFIEECRTKAEIATAHFNYLKVQMEMRKLFEGDLANCDKFDEEQYEALVQGIKQPQIQLDSAGFIILSGRELLKTRKKGGRTF
ncbi:protein DpdE [Paenibacillus sp. NPDC058174]|uniref:protein DpdE n=1 Tax=Paenibacillus sp. NPDC058174 TaxID=3346366 RepID=UPI0036DCE75A